MAKGNLFLGTAARSVGDVVMYRREGSQVSRVRVRKIANPKTDAQCEQRAFMSAVVKFYQPLANVLDRSWQGLSRAKSYAKFLKTNVGIVRAGGYYIPKDSGIYPLPLALSRGSMLSPKITFMPDEMTIPLTKPADLPAEPSTMGDLSKMFVASGYNNGSVVTLIAIGFIDATHYYPKSYQFAVDTTSTETIENALPNLTIDFITSGTTGITVGFKGVTVKGYGIIISENVDGVWHRTNSDLVCHTQVLDSLTTPEAKAAAIASYKGAAANDNPLVYLDGDELENA